MELIHPAPATDPDGMLRPDGIAFHSSILARGAARKAARGSNHVPIDLLWILAYNDAVECRRRRVDAVVPQLTSNLEVIYAPW
jgi:hypothetical protein